jgi:type I restriction enzyme S subunit
MRYEKLSELLDISMGRTPSRSEPNYWGKGHKWVSIRDLNSKIITDTKEQITDLAVKEARCKLVPKGTLLFSFKLTIGKMAFAGCDLYTNEAIAAFPIKDKAKLNAEFLYYALLSANFGGSNQAAMGKTLNSKSLADIEIPLPPLQDQLRIAHLLGKVEGLIGLRKQNLQQLDDLLKSVFLEMFGDPINNPKGFPVKKLSEFYITPKDGTKCGPFGSALKKDELVDSGVPVWNMDNISISGQMISPYRMWITEEKYKDLQSYAVFDGDIIISRAGTVGKMCVAKTGGEPAIISTNLIRVRLNQNLRPLHFVSLMLYCKGRVGRLKTGPDGTFTHMNTGVLDNLEFPYPPLELQNKFSLIFEKVEDIRSCYQKSLTDLESLYGVLSQHAFNGELDLSRISPARQSITPDIVVNRAQAFSPAVEQLTAINLPETDLLLPALQDRKLVKDLLHKWLEIYCTQLGDAAFSVAGFMNAAQIRIAELHPDTDFELDTNDYEHIKTWIFETLYKGELTQSVNITGHDKDGKPIVGNFIEVKRGASH